MLTVLSWNLIGLQAEPGIFVSNHGSDLNPGTMELPLKSIQEGISRLSAGDTLFLREGNYHEEVLIESLNGSAESTIVITAYESEKVRLDGTENIEDLALFFRSIILGKLQVPRPGNGKMCIVQ